MSDSRQNRRSYSHSQRQAALKMQEAKLLKIRHKEELKQKQIVEITQTWLEKVLPNWSIDLEEPAPFKLINERRDSDILPGLGALVPVHYLVPTQTMYSNDSKLVKELCMKGIPSHLRGRVWPLLIGNRLQVKTNEHFFL